MLESTKRHKRIAGLQGKILGAITALLIGATALFGGVQKFNNNDALEARATAETRIEFWEVVASKKTPQGTTIVNKLAINLREALGTVDPSATELPEAVTSFTAGPSDYPGVISDLGIEIFNDEGLSCSDCGPLNAYMQNQLLSIKQGNVSSITAAETAAMPVVQDVSLAPFGMPVLLWGALAYLTATTASLMVAVRIDSKRYQYHRVLLNWGSDGGSSTDPYKRMSKAMAFPHFWAIIKIDEKLGKSLRDVLKEVNLSEEATTIAQLKKQLEALPEGRKRSDLRAMLDELEGGINEQVSNYLGRDREFKQMEADALSQRIADTAQSISDKLDVRRSAHKELETGVSSSMDETMAAIEAALSNKPEPKKVSRPRSQPG